MLGVKKLEDGLCGGGTYLGSGMPRGTTMTISILKNWRKKLQRGPIHILNEHLFPFENFSTEFGFDVGNVVRAKLTKNSLNQLLKSLRMAATNRLAEISLRNSFSESQMVKN